MAYSGKTEQLKVLLLFTLLSLGYTLPLVFDLNSVIGGDGHFFVHSFWWFRKALSSLHNPFFTDYLFYPEGVSLVFQSSTFSNYLLTAPIAAVAGINVAVNVAYILTYILSGYFAFLLALDLTGSRPAALISGLIYAFNPFHLAHAGHLHIATQQWLPLYLLLFKRSLERQDKRWPVLAGLVMGVIVLTDQFQTILAALITLLVLPVLPLLRSTRGEGRAPGSPKGIRKVTVVLAIIAGVTLLTSGWYLYQAAGMLVTSHEALKVGPFAHGGANTFSGDLLGYLVPPPFHPLWGKLVAPFSPGGESILFLGYLPLLLAAAGAVAGFRRPLVGLVAVLTAGFWVVSLGTTLHIGGVWEWHGSSYELPFLQLMKLPVLADIRSPARFHLVTSLGVALLAGFGAAWLFDRLKRNPTPPAIMLGVVILLEFLPPPHHMESAAVPPIYRRMAADPEPYTVLELPLARWSALQKNGTGNPTALMYFQTVHGKRLIGGYLSRVTEEALDFKDPILDLFAEINQYDRHQIIEAEQRLANDQERSRAEALAASLVPNREEFLRRNRIKYIVLHPPVAAVGTMTRIFTEKFIGKPLVEDGSGLAFAQVQ